MTFSECAAHAPVLAAIGACASKGSGEQSSAARCTRGQLGPATDL